MKKFCFLIIVVSVCKLQLYSQHFTSLTHIYSEIKTFELVDTEVDNEKNSYVVYKVNFQGWYNIIVIKTDSNGASLWTQQLGCCLVIPTSIAIDKNNNFYMAGYLGPGGTVIFNNHYLQLNNVLFEGGFILSFTKSGTYRYMKEAPKGDLTVDSSNNIYLTNEHATIKLNAQQQFLWADSTLPGTQIIHYSSNIIYVLSDSLFRIDKNGTKLWKRPKIGATRFSIDGDGNAYLVTPTQLYKRFNNGYFAWTFPEGGKDVTVDLNRNFVILKDSEMVYVDWHGSQVLRRAKFVGDFNRINFIGNRVICNGVFLCGSINPLLGYRTYFLPPFSFRNNDLCEGINAICDFSSNSHVIANEYFFQIPSGYCNSDYNWGAGIEQNSSTPCADIQYHLNFRVNKEFNSGNIFSVQISDENGSFNVANTIGAIVASNDSLLIPIKFPSTLKSGLNYKIRIVSSSPAVISNYNGIPFQFKRPAQSSVSAENGITSFCYKEGKLLANIDSTFLNSSFLEYINWFMVGDTIPSGSGFSFYPIKSGKYYLTVGTSGSNCFSYSKDSVSVIVWPKPSAKITSPSTVICDTTQILITANTGTGLSYKWYRNNGLLNGFNGSTYFAMDTGTYKSVVTNNKGCSRTSNQIKLTQFKASISALGPVTFCNGGNVFLTTQYSQNYTYQWKKNNVNIPGQISNLYNATTAGSYKVLVANNTGCVLTTPAIVVTVPCRNQFSDQSDETNYSVNFINDAYLEINSNFSDDENGHVELFALDGKLISKATLVNGHAILPAVNLNTGLFIVRINKSSNTTVLKIAKL